MTGTQTDSPEQAGTVQAAPPPFRVPVDSACVTNCDEAPLGWSTPAVGAANLPASAQGGEGDMIGCWQVAPGTDPHGASLQGELMQLYVSTDAAGGNEGVWFRVRDESFNNWTSLVERRIETQAGFRIKAFGWINADGTLRSGVATLNIASVHYSTEPHTQNNNNGTRSVYTITFNYPVTNALLHHTDFDCHNEEIDNTNKTRIVVRVWDAHHGVPSASRRQFKFLIFGD